MKERVLVLGVPKKHEEFKCTQMLVPRTAVILLARALSQNDTPVLATYKGKVSGAIVAKEIYTSL